MSEIEVKRVFDKNGVTFKNSMFKIKKEYSLYFDNVDEDRNTSNVVSHLRNKSKN